MMDGFFGSLVALAVSFGAPSPLTPGNTQTYGSPLTETNNLQIGCETRPTLAPDASGNFVFGPSSEPDCTWRQGGVFGVSSDPRFSSVPGTGRIVQVRVKSGPRPAPLRVVTMRQYAHPRFYHGCCFFTGESKQLRPRPNAISTFAVNLPVMKKFVDGILVVDLVGISAESGKGTLPLHTTGRNNAFQLTEQGSVNAGFFYRRVGGIPNDSGGGRPEEGIPGIEVLMQWTWSPA